ncbi:hypothetical protein AVEN_25532-1 [Araneus ventricosus]|uniref:Uncharacterized protein n=1 Tax=Araneus ventricosus TaxID=182803 RepID=A0A4Y2QFY2_ARAVE|nr:hypothetical protein AVEN_25532-1 [Araneus ventricosus]
MRTCHISKQSLAARWDIVMVVWLLGPSLKTGSTPVKGRGIVEWASRNEGYNVGGHRTQFDVVVSGLSDVLYSRGLGVVFSLEFLMTLL